MEGNHAFHQATHCKLHKEVYSRCFSNTLSFPISLPRWRRRGPRLQAPGSPKLRRSTQRLSNNHLWALVISYLRSNSDILHMRTPRRRKQLGPVNHEIYGPTFSGRNCHNHRHERGIWTLPISSNSLVKQISKREVPKAV
jgi:hypothetical protein